MGQLPPDRLTPGAVFEKVGIDFADDLTQIGSHQEANHYICLFVSLTMNVMHRAVVIDKCIGSF